MKKILTNCNGCPIINTSEQGYDCNLEYTILEREAHQFDNLRKQIPQSWRYMSFDCRLHHVATCDECGDWRPSRISIHTIRGKQ